MSKSNPTDRQVSANRLNAQKSTGPRSARGKQRSSRNSFKLGLFASDLVIPGEDPREFQQHRNEMLKSLNPSDVIELALVERIVEADWKLKRLRGAETAHYREHAQGLHEQHENSLVDAKDQLRDFRAFHRGELDPNSEWAKTHPGELEKNQTRLSKLEQKIVKARQRIGQPPNAAEMTLNLLRDNPFATPELEKIMKYQQQLTGTFSRCLNQLRQLKKEKRDGVEEPTELTIALTEGAEEIEDEISKTNPIESQPSAGQEVVEAPEQGIHNLKFQILNRRCQLRWMDYHWRTAPSELRVETARHPGAPGWRGNLRAFSAEAASWKTRKDIIGNGGAGTSCASAS